MKSGKIILLSFLLLTVLCSCDREKTSEITFHTDLINYNLYRGNGSSNEFSFNITVTSKVKDYHIEFISAKGKNTDHLSVSFSDDSFEDFKNKNIHGFYLSLLGVRCRCTSNYTRINSMKLKVNGVEKTITFFSPIENTFYDIDSNEHYLSQRNLPLYVFTNSFVGQNETPYIFSFSVMDNLRITNIQFRDFLDFYNASLYINDRRIGNEKEHLPLNLKKGDSLTIKTLLKHKSTNELFMGNVLTNLMIAYESKDKTFTDYYPLTAAYISNKEDAEAFVLANVLNQ